MITKEDYLNALDIVTEYHIQLKNDIGLLNSTDKFDLRQCIEGTSIRCVKTNSKYLTIGNKYTFIKVDNVGRSNWWGEIRNDRGDKLIISNRHHKMWTYEPNK